jgi:hypothetical protein
MDESQTLVIGMGNQLMYQLVVDGDKTIYGIIDDFSKRHGC